MKMNDRCNSTFSQHPLKSLSLFQVQIHPGVESLESVGAQHMQMFALALVTTLPNVHQFPMGSVYPSIHMSARTKIKTLPTI